MYNNNNSGRNQACIIYTKKNSETHRKPLTDEININITCMKKLYSIINRIYTLYSVFPVSANIYTHIHINTLIE